MGGQTDAAFGQEQTRFAPHLAVEPGVGIGKRRPDPFVQPAEDDEVRALHARLDRAPDHDAGMRSDRIADLGPVEDAREQRRIVADGEVGSVDGLAQELLHHLARLAAGGALPEPAGSGLPGGGGDTARRLEVALHQLGERRHAARRQVGQGLEYPVEPGDAPLPFLRPSLQRRPVRKGRAVPADVKLEVAGVKEVLSARGRDAMGQRVLEKDEQVLGRELAAHEPGDMAQEPPRRREGEGHARAVVRHDPPAVELRGHAARQHPVGRDEGGGRAVLRRLAETGGDGQRLGMGIWRFEQRQTLGRPRRIAEQRSFGHPLMRHRSGAERQRHEAVPGRGRRAGFGPGPDIGGREAEPVHQPPEAVLGVVLGRQRLGVERLPVLGRHPEVVARQDELPLRQPRDQRHEGRRRAARSGRARDDHRMPRRHLGPEPRQPLHGHALPAFGVGRRVRRFEISEHDIEEGAAPPPVIGGVGIVDPRDSGPAHALALHLVEKRGEAVGEVVERRARGEVGIGLEKRAHEPREFEPAADRRDGGRQVGGHEVAPEVGDQADAREETRPAAPEQPGDAPLHAPGVHPELDPGEGFGRERPVPGEKSVDQRGREIGAGRKGEDGHALSRRSASAARSPSGEPASHQRPG